MSKIRLLDELTANQIAAGEVVERPASIAKELMENAVDAGATAITLEIRDGGTSYLRVTDNGSGIEEGDCRLAFERHATSKISSREDLNSIGTLGFRGEALPSIASVSKVEMTTRTKDAKSGTKVLITGGHIDEIKAAGSPQGTTIVVRDLFFNTPARRKFLKKPHVEAGYVADVAAHLALSRPDIAVRFVNNSKTIYQTTGNGDLKTVIYMLHGKETADELIPVSGFFGSVECHGFVGVGNSARATRAYEFFFLNGRYIQSQVLSAAVEQAASERVMIGRFPYCVLNINVPLDSVDVNVHPNKLEVRFRDGYPIRENLHEILLTAFPRPAPLEAPPQAPRFMQLKKEQLPLRPENRNIKSDETSNPIDEGNIPAFPEPSLSMPPSTGMREPSGEIDLGQGSNIWEEPAEAAVPPVPTSRPYIGPSPIIIGQLFETYMLVQLGDELVIVDQHAAHERILYERFKKQLGQEGLSQTMLSPYVFTVTPKEEALLQDNLAVIEQLGFEIDSFGPRTMRVTAVPYLLGQPSLQSFIIELVDQIEDIGTMRELDLKRDTLIRLACHSAIKGGDRLSNAELSSLLETIEGENIPLTCPHGRPILMRMTKRELERKFKRIP